MEITQYGPKPPDVPYGDSHSVPHLVQHRQRVYGKVDAPLPLYSMDSIDRFELRHDWQDYDTDHPLDPSPYQDLLATGMSGMGCGGDCACNTCQMNGLGADQGPPPSVTVPLIGKIETSTVVAVVAAGTVAIIASIALWAWSKSKK